jgi:hypothetical protein
MSTTVKKLLPDLRPEGVSEDIFRDDFELPENRQLPPIPTLPEMPQPVEDPAGEPPADPA